MAQQLRSEGEGVPLLFMLDPPGKTKEPVPPLRERWRQYVHELTGRAPRAKLEFVLRSVITAARDSVKGRTAAIGKHITRLRWTSYLRSGRLLPPSLRSPYILDVYRSALRSYAPQPYSGPVTIYKAGNMRYTSPMNWQELMTGELQIHEGAGSHMDLMTESYVAVWAEKLRHALDTVTIRTGGVE
jgi:thioesterase domain-containing protein